MAQPTKLEFGLRRQFHRRHEDSDPAVAKAASMLGWALEPKRRQVANLGQQWRPVKDAIERRDGDPLIANFEDAEGRVAGPLAWRELAPRQIVERIEVACCERAG